MRTYSHTLLTYASMRLVKRASNRDAALAALGATFPDAPAILGAAWLWLRRKTFSREDFDEQVCGRSLFREPDAAFHSASVVAAAMALERILRGKNSAFLLGWAGHVLTDFLTHGEDARQVFWPVSRWRFRSPISYRERKRHGRLFTVVEHAAVLATLISLLARAWRTHQKLTADG